MFPVAREAREREKALRFQLTSKGTNAVYAAFSDVCKREHFVRSGL